MTANGNAGAKSDWLGELPVLKGLLQLRLPSD